MFYIVTFFLKKIKTDFDFNKKESIMLFASSVMLITGLSPVWSGGFRHIMSITELYLFHFS